MQMIPSFIGNVFGAAFLVLPLLCTNALPSSQPLNILSHIDIYPERSCPPPRPRPGRSIRRPAGRRERWDPNARDAHRGREQEGRREDLVVQPPSFRFNLYLQFHLLHLLLSRFLCEFPPFTDLSPPHPTDRTGRRPHTDTPQLPAPPPRFSPSLPLSLSPPTPFHLQQCSLGPSAAF